MSTVTTARSSSLLSIDFPDLYARHLCRHSQWGINVAHLAALFGTWFGVYGFVYWLCHMEWVVVALGVAYLAVLAPHVPMRVAAACTVFLALLVAAVLWTPELPFWAYLVMVPVFYKLQSWSHLVWSKATDMTEFNKKYPKGFTMFMVLLIYEVPMVLNYLLFSFTREALAERVHGVRAPLR